MLTSSDQASDKQKARALGADDYVVKPAGMQGMISIIKEFLG